VCGDSLAHLIVVWLGSSNEANLSLAATGSLSRESQREIALAGASAAKNQHGLVSSVLLHEWAA
jgi:hypothetical protein